MIKRFFILILLCIIGTGFLFSQDIQTASDYFDQIAEQYAVTDYISDIIYTHEEGSQSGTLYYKEPNKLRIEFTNPKGQILNSDGRTVTAYFPNLRVALLSPLRKGNTGLAGAVSGEGLNLMRQNYSISYLETRNPVPLEEDSDVMVVKLRLVPRTSREGFRQLDISVGTDGYIRRIVGLNQEYREIQLDFLNIRINPNIPDNFFDYDPPPEANVHNNFLGVESE
ncbi:MAG: LolA family protein [Spirochaetia bacterium]